MPERRFEVGGEGYADALREAQLPEDGIQTATIIGPEFLARENLDGDVAQLIPAGELDPLRFIASTEAVGRDGDIIEAKAWTAKGLAPFRKNPVFLWEHNLRDRTLPIGRVPKVGVEKSDAVGRHLAAVVALDEEDPFARKVHSMYRRGILNAVSVRWLTKAFKVPSDDERKEKGLGPFGIIVSEAELLEISAVTVPGDSKALKQRALEGSPLPPAEDVEEIFGAETASEVAEISAGRDLATDEVEFRLALLAGVRNLIDEVRAMTESVCARIDELAFSTEHRGETIVEEPSEPSGRSEDTEPPEDRDRTDRAEAPPYFETLSRVAEGLDS